jgi:anti-anti-sigma regulatory factor
MPPSPPLARDWGGHLLMLHRGEPERLGWLAAWVRDGLDRGEKIVYVEPADSGPASIAVGLRAHGIDVDALRAERRVEILTPEVYYPVGAPEAVVDRALADRFPAVRISGSAGSALAVVSAAGHRDIEWVVDRLCRTRPVSALCQYAYPIAAGPPLPAVLQTHPGGLHERSLAATATGADLVLRGRADATNAAVLTGLVDTAAYRAAATAIDRLRVDLTGVDHLDGSACRALAAASEPYRDAGLTVALGGAGPDVERALRAGGLAELPGVELAA